MKNQGPLVLSLFLHTYHSHVTQSKEALVQFEGKYCSTKAQTTQSKLACWNVYSHTTEQASLSVQDPEESPFQGPLHTIGMCWKWKPVPDHTTGTHGGFKAES